MFTLQGVPYVPEDLANQPDAAQEDGFDAVLENEDAEGEEEEERHKNAKDDNDYPQSVDIFTSGLRASLVPRYEGWSRIGVQLWLVKRCPEILQIMTSTG